MLALLDGDTPIYAAAVMAEGQSEQIACWNFNAAIEKLLDSLNRPNYRLYCTGKNNFRYNIYPEYKANRGPDPTYREVVKQYAIEHWGAILSEGCEADDLIAIDHTMEPEETMIVSIDKDFDQVPGWRYNPGIMRKGVVVTPPRRYLVSPTDAIRFFYYQLLIGDTTDNIKGVPGIGKKKATKILEGLTTEEELLQAVREHYSCDEELEMNAACLHLWRKPGDIWSLKEVEARLSQEQGQDPTEVR